MTVAPRTFILLFLDAYGGKVEGKTKLQKLIYFAGVMTRKLDLLGYVPHYYGPYSATVEDAVGQLCSLGLLERRAFRYGPGDRRGFEQVRYDYRLTEAGKQLAGHKAGRLPNTAESLRTAVEGIRQAGDASYMGLSYAAKAFFLLRQEGGTATADQIRARAREFGWDVRDEDVNTAVDFLRALKLVKESPAA